MKNILVLVAMLSALTAALPSAQAGKKVFISADMEGISGISSPDQLSATGAEYGRSRKMMADDVNAAIRGAAEAGADYRESGRPITGAADPAEAARRIAVEIAGVPA